MDEFEKNNRARPLSYVKLCPLFQSHQWIPTGVRVSKCSIRVKIGHSISRVTLKSDGWPREAIGYLFYATPSFVHLFVAIGRGHQSTRKRVTVQKCSIPVKIGKFLSYVILKFDGWPWKTIGNLFYAILSLVHHFVALWKFKLELQSRNSQIGAKFISTSLTLTFDGWTDRQMCP